MSNTVADLSNAVKRFLVSNTNLVNLVPGQTLSGQMLEQEVNEGILVAMNNARKHAEKLHDFAANEKKGSAVLTCGSPINLDRVPTKRFFSGTASSTIAADGVEGIESSLLDWPELSLKVQVTGEPVDVSKVVSVCFGGTVHSPLQSGVEYSVIDTNTGDDGAVVLTLGISPGTVLNVAGSTVIFNTGKIASFKTIRSAGFVQRTHFSPIKVQQAQAQMIRSLRAQGLGMTPRYAGDEANTFCQEKALTIEGRFGYVSPPSDRLDIFVSGHVWMDAYVNDYDTDFLLAHGFEFMMWQTIIEMNHLILKYVARQEGTIAPPVAARDAAWDALVLWDAHSVDGNIYYDL